MFQRIHLSFVVFVELLCVNNFKGEQVFKFHGHLKKIGKIWTTQILLVALKAGRAQLLIVRDSN